MLPRGSMVSPFAAAGVFHMPGYMTEGPVRRVQGQSDYQLVEGRGKYGLGAPVVEPVPGFPVYAWRPAGDGTSAQWPHDIDMAPYMGFLPYMEGTMNGALGCAGNPDCVGCKGLGQFEAGGEKYAGIKLGLQIVSTAALVTIVAVGVHSALKKRGR